MSASFLFDNLFFGCTPAVHLILPVLSFVILAFSIIIIAGSETGEKPGCLEIAGGLAIVLLGISVPSLFGVFGLVAVLYYFAKMVIALAALASKAAPGAATVVVAVGFILPVAISWKMEDIISYRSIMALSFLLKMSVAFSGVLLIRSIIRKTGINPDMRINSIKVYSAITGVLVFLTLAFRFNLVFNNDMSLYFNILKTKTDTFILVFCILAAGAALFHLEEKKAAENCRSQSLEEDE